MIVDEADEIVRNFAISFSPNNEIQGLFTLKDRNFILCSATFSQMEK